MKLTCSSLILLCLFPVFCQAFMVRGPVWFLSEAVTNDVYLHELCQVEEKAKNGELKAACEILDDLRAEEASNGSITKDGEPLQLTLTSAYLWYKAEASGNKDKKIVEEARKALDKWAEPAKGKQWKSYKFLYHRLRSFYVCSGNAASRIEVQKEMIMYDPQDMEQFASLEEYCRRYPEHSGDMTLFLKALRKAGAVIPPYFELLEISLGQNRSNMEKLELVIEWLRLKKHSDYAVIKAGVESGLQYVTSDNQKSARRFYMFLTDLAMWQIGDDSRIPIIAFLLNERAKMVAINPKCAE